MPCDSINKTPYAYTELHKRLRTCESCVDNFCRFAQGGNHDRSEWGVAYTVQATLHAWAPAEIFSRGQKGLGAVGDENETPQATNVVRNWEWLFPSPADYSGPGGAS